MNWNEDAAFVRAVAIVFLHEGGYSNNPADPGGETKFGISRRSYPDLDIISLTRDEAAGIYYRDWWVKYGYARLPEAVGIKLLDFAVAAPIPAHKALQRALKACGEAVDDDGRIGPQTLAALETADAKAVVAAMKSEFAGYCRLISVKRKIEGLPSFEAGWLARCYS